MNFVNPADTYATLMFCGLDGSPLARYSIPPRCTLSLDHSAFPSLFDAYTIELRDDSGGTRLIGFTTDGYRGYVDVDEHGLMRHSNPEDPRNGQPPPDYWVEIKYTL